MDIQINFKNYTLVGSFCITNYDLNDFTNELP